MDLQPTASPLSRRRLLALSGATLAAGSATVLAACGAATDDEPSDSEDAAALNRVLAQQLAVLEAARAASKGAPEQAAGAIAALRNLRDRSTQELASAITDLSGTATREPAPQAVQAESAVEGLASQLDAAIAGQLAVIGELSSDRRAPVQRAITEDAATLAILRATLGEPPAPDAFVFGTAGGADAATAPAEEGA